MGRKGSFAERPVKGPGRKTKKQGPPVLTKGFKGPQVYILISHHFPPIILTISYHCYVDGQLIKMNRFIKMIKPT